MFASRRLEALRRAAEVASRAGLARLDAEETRKLADQDDADQESRDSLLRSAEIMSNAAEDLERVSMQYLAMFQEGASAQQHDDADGWG